MRSDVLNIMYALFQQAGKFCHLGVEDQMC